MSAAAEASNGSDAPSKLSRNKSDRTLQLRTEYEALQAKTFTRFMNSHLR